MKITLILTFLLSATSFAGLTYKPQNLNPSSAEVVIVLHGCLQSAETMENASGWNQVADENNLVMIYPQVPKFSNPMNCWSWYLSENLRRDSGQLKGIVDEVDEVVVSLALKSPKIYVVGMSAGAAAGAGLLACFPEKFSGGALHSGLPYGSATNLAEAEKVMFLGAGDKNKGPCKPEEFKGGVLILQGMDDKVVNPNNASKIATQFSQSPSTSDATVIEGENVYTVYEFGSSRTQMVMIKNLGHAWSGNDSGSMFFSKTGPNATGLMWNFLKSY